MSKYFIVETKEKISEDDYFKLRTLYAPVIGKSAIFIYETLMDFYKIKAKNKLYSNMTDLVSLLLMSQPQIFEELKKLEAVGLLRTFIDSSENTSIFSLLRPLDVIRFRKNSFLFNQFKKRVGTDFFEKITNTLEEPQVVKDELMEVTAKFQDVFDIDMMLQENKEHVIENTLEIPLGIQMTREKAFATLTPAQYINYLTKEKVTSTQLNALNTVSAFGFDNKATNTLIDYSHERNDGKIISNYILKIARDLFKRGITIDYQIKKELQSIKRKPKTIDLFSLTKKDINTNDYNISEGANSLKGNSSNQNNEYEEWGMEDVEW